MEYFRLYCNIILGWVFFGAVSDIALNLSWRYYRSASVDVRLCAAVTSFAWLLSVIFSLLITLGLFMPIPAAGVAVFLLAAYAKFGNRETGVWRYFVADMERVWRFLVYDMARGGFLRWCWRGVLFFFFLLTMNMYFRGLVLPPLGWDTMTYHGAKIGMWIQSGGWPDLKAPGSWEYYRVFLGGGEALASWSMLFTRSELLAIVPEIGAWLMTGLAFACCLARMGLPKGPSALLGMGLICVYDIVFFVGTGYVDKYFHALLFTSMLFILRYAETGKIRDLAFFAMAFGLMATIKLNCLAASILFAPLTLLPLLKHRRSVFKALALGIALYSIPIVPWLYHSYRDCGYLLGTVDLAIGPLRIGAAAPNLKWLLEFDRHKSYKLQSELVAIAFPLLQHRFYFFMALLCLPFSVRLFRKPRIDHLLVLGIGAVFAILYYSDSFSTVRIHWKDINGRFIVPMVAVPILIGAPYAYRAVWSRALLIALAAASIVLGWFEFHVMIVHPSFYEYIYFSFAFIATLLVSYLSLAFIARNSIYLTFRQTCLTIALFSIVMVIGDNVKLSWRIRAFQTVRTNIYCPLYWAPILPLLENDEEYVIAMAYGSVQISHITYIVPLLGPRYFHRVTFVSPEEDGAFLPHTRDYDEKTNPSYNRWLERLVDQGVTHLICFRPVSVEYEWALEHPKIFVPLKGDFSTRENDHDRWGFFRIESENIPKNIQAP